MLPFNTDYDCMWLRVSIWSLWDLFKRDSDQNPTNPKWNCNTDDSKITKYTFYYLKTCHSLFKLLWFCSFIVTSAAQQQIRSIYLQMMRLTLQISPCFQHTGNDADQLQTTPVVYTIPTFWQSIQYVSFIAVVYYSVFIYHLEVNSVSLTRGAHAVSNSHAWPIPFMTVLTDMLLDEVNG